LVIEVIEVTANLVGSQQRGATPSGACSRIAPHVSKLHATL